MAKVRFKVKFMDWKKGDTTELDKATAERYVGFGVCTVVKPGRPKKQVKSAPKNKMQTGAAKTK